MRSSHVRCIRRASLAELSCNSPLSLASASPSSLSSSSELATDESLVRAGASGAVLRSRNASCCRSVIRLGFICRSSSSELLSSLTAAADACPARWRFDERSM